jgi:hypothetical protein
MAKTRRYRQEIVIPIRPLPSSRHHHLRGPNKGRHFGAFILFLNEGRGDRPSFQQRDLCYRELNCLLFLVCPYIQCGHPPVSLPYPQPQACLALGVAPPQCEAIKSRSLDEQEGRQLQGARATQVAQRPAAAEPEVRYKHVTSAEDVR